MHFIYNEIISDKCMQTITIKFYANAVDTVRSCAKSALYHQMFGGILFIVMVITELCCKFKGTGHG